MEKSKSESTKTLSNNQLKMLNLYLEFIEGDISYCRALYFQKGDSFKHYVSGLQTSIIFLKRHLFNNHFEIDCNQIELLIACIERVNNEFVAGKTNLEVKVCMNLIAQMVRLKHLLKEIDVYYTEEN